MSTFAQNLIALLLVAACVAYVGRQLFRTITAGKGKAGSCCGKGCGGDEKSATTSARPREQFIDSDLLRRPRKS